MTPAPTGGHVVPAVSGQPAATVLDDPVGLLPGDAAVAVAMSGGVDSSVAAALLAARGVRCFGVTLAMWPRDGEHVRDRGCCSVDAVEDARRVCGHLGIPHYAWNLEDGFRNAVIADFEAEYLAARTPNPCVRCNERVKFGLLLGRALAAGATHVATGHYARLGRRGTVVTLHRGADPAKDQAYTLHRVSQEGLRRAVLPVGVFPSKAAVRAEASRMGLATAAKPDSQELCFVDGRVGDELARRLQGRYAPGELVDGDGAVVGSHPGLPFLTVGQRSGLRLTVRRPDAAPTHVLRLDAAANRAVVGPASAMDRTTVVASDCRWLDRPPVPGSRAHVQLRARAEPVGAEVVTSAPDRVQLVLDTATRGVAPGQSLVLYHGDEVIGGGLIEEG